ncbi:hypothetical protein GGI07_003347 [Coemansia sp. Benny D115]|nr:hypothetical protein GGI07_003347 [Coemansia sp. Benny D115]
MFHLPRLSLTTLACLALLATKVIADELEDVVGEIPAPAAETQTATVAPAELSLGNYKVEAMLVALAIGLIANYFYGSRKNSAIVKRLEGPITEVLRANFSLVGDGSRVLEWDSAADMLFYASGRRHCRFAQGHIMLKARQDAVALVNDLLANNQEKLEVEVILNDDAFSGFVFAAVQRKRSKALARDRYDVSTFAKVVANDSVAPNVVVFSENGDATAQLLGSGLQEILADEAALLEELIVSDSPAEKPDSHDFKREKRIYAIVRLPQEHEDVAKFKDTFDFVFYLADFLAEGLALRPETTRRLAKSREEAFKEFARLAEQDKQDALAKVVAEKRRIELEEVAKMSPEQRRKWEEKDRKKQLKKEQSKRTRRIR